MPQASDSAQAQGRPRNRFTAAHFGSTFWVTKGGNIIKVFAVRRAAGGRSRVKFIFGSWDFANVFGSRTAFSIFGMLFADGSRSAIAVRRCGAAANGAAQRAASIIMGKFSGRGPRSPADCIHNVMPPSRSLREAPQKPIIQTAKTSPCALQGDVKGPRAENRTEKATSRSSRRGSRGSR